VSAVVQVPVIVRVPVVVTASRRWATAIASSPAAVVVAVGFVVVHAIADLNSAVVSGAALVARSHATAQRDAQ
jgi:hypothetical protein